MKTLRFLSKLILATVLISGTVINASAQKKEDWKQKIMQEKIAFFTNITHEFRTPVTLINGPIKKVLKESTEVEVQEQLKLAEKNSNYLLSLVNELMDFRKLDAEKVVLQLQNQD